MSAFARARSVARSLSAPRSDAPGLDGGPGGGGLGSGGAGAAGLAGGLEGGGGGGGGGEGVRMNLSSLSMPLGGAKRVAAAMEGIARAAVLEDGEAAGHGNEWGLTLQQQRIVTDLMRLRQLVHKAVSKMDQSQLEALLYAAGSGDADAVQGLLRQGMSPDSANSEGTTPLLLAAMKGHNDVVLALLFLGADPSKGDSAGRTPLLVACQNNHVGVVDILMRYGAKLGMEPVMLAAYMCKIVFEGKLDELRRLLRARADPNATDYDKQAPLHIAAAEGNLPAARVLVEEGRANVLLADRWGRTPLDTALKANAMQIVEYLESRPEVGEEQKAAARQRFEQERTDDLLNACCWGDVAAVRSLLRRGCPADSRDYDGRTALFVAAVNGQAEVARQLLDAGGDPNAQNSFGSCPLLEACLSGHDNVIDLLIMAGARLNQPEVEEAALLSTVIHGGDTAQLRRLVRAMADPAAADYDGRTPLHVAASRGDVDALGIIAEVEDDDSSFHALPPVRWEVRDKSGLTPQEEAARTGHKRAAEFVKRRAEASRAAGRGTADAAAPTGPRGGAGGPTSGGGGAAVGRGWRRGQPLGSGGSSSSGGGGGGVGEPMPPAFLSMRFGRQMSFTGRLGPRPTASALSSPGPPGGAAPWDPAPSNAAGGAAGSGDGDGGAGGAAAAGATASAGGGGEQGQRA